MSSKELGTPLYSTGVIAKLFNLTERRIQQLTKEGIIQQVSRGKYELAPTIQRYIKFLQDRAFGKGNTDSDYQKEKVLLTRANRQKAELEVKIIKGELHRAEDVKRVMNDMLGAFRARCLAIPSKTAPRVLGHEELTIIQNIIKKEVYEALSELSDYDPTIFYQSSRDKLVIGKEGELDEEIDEDEPEEGDSK